MALHLGKFNFGEVFTGALFIHQPLKSSVKSSERLEVSFDSTSDGHFTKDFVGVFAISIFWVLLLLCVDRDPY